MILAVRGAAAVSASLAALRPPTVVSNVDGDHLRNFRYRLEGFDVQFLHGHAKYVALFEMKDELNKRHGIEDASLKQVRFLSFHPDGQLLWKQLLNLPDQLAPLGRHGGGRRPV